MADNNPKPPPKPPTRPLDDKMKDLDAQDRLDNFEQQRLMSRETSDPQEGGEIAADPEVLDRLNRAVRTLAEYDAATVAA